MITIENYAKDLNKGVFYGWDVISADESNELYSFQLRSRMDMKLRVYVTLSRELQYAELPYYPEMMYQCYVTDDNGEWQHRSWFREHDLTYKNFWNVVEDVVDKNVDTQLPF